MRENGKPLVSVIMPCFKMGPFIGEALESVGAQTYPHWEVIVVDDAGPEDGARAAVEAFAAKQAGHRVEYIRHETNQGVSAARNTAIAAARGELLAFLDPDDAWAETHLCAHVAAHFLLPGVVPVSRVRVLDNKEGSLSRDEFGLTEWEQKIFPLSLAFWNPIPPAAVTMRKELLTQVGGFDEDRPLQHSEDWDLWLRLVDAGAVFRFLDDVTVLYRKHEGAATADRLAMRKRAEAFAHKHADSLQVKLSLATHMLGQRVDGLEARLNHLQGNPIVRLISALGSLFRKQGK